MLGANKFGMPAWLAAVVAAWFVGPEVGLAATLGLIAQWTLKAPANVADWLSPVAVTLACFVAWVFVLGHAPARWYPLPDRSWWEAFAVFAASTLGLASTAGQTGGAPASNSLSVAVTRTGLAATTTATAPAATQAPAYGAYPYGGYGYPYSGGYGYPYGGYSSGYSFGYGGGPEVAS